MEKYWILISSYEDVHKWIFLIAVNLVYIRRISGCPRYVPFFVCFTQQFCASPQSSHSVLVCPISPLFLGAQPLNHPFIIQGCLGLLFPSSRTPRIIFVQFLATKPFFCIFDHCDQA
jgi:hypothetical protein